MNRRNFLSALVGGVVAAAAVRTWPFRVFSFPSAPVTPTLDEITHITLDELTKAIDDKFYVDTPLMEYLRRGQRLYMSSPRMSATVTGITVPTNDEVEAFG